MDEKLKFGIITLIVIVFQSILKIYGLLITGSLTLLSETVDTIVDIIFVSITIYSISQSQKPADYEHMYGHSKIDTIGAFVQGIILINVYVLLIINAILVIMAGTYIVANPMIGVQILIISFIVNIIFSRILIWEGKRHKSPTLKMQGLNLFQDSIRAIIVLISFLLMLFDIIFLDPFFSIAISIWIIIGAFFLAKNGIKDLTDTNPINPLIIEEINAAIFNIDHVNSVEDLKIRASGNVLFLEVRLSVEDHISVVHAHEITKSIRALGKKNFSLYEVEFLIEMNPLGGEPSVRDNLINIIYSMKAEFPEISNLKDLNIFSFEDKYFLSLTLVINKSLTLKEAHNICTTFEKELKEQAPYLSRIIAHIEGERIIEEKIKKETICTSLSPEKLKEIEILVIKILGEHPQVKGCHGFEFWAAGDYCVLELHIFFDGDLNISQVHEYITDLEQKIQELKIENLQEIILHSEPLKGRKDGIFFLPSKKEDT